MTTRRARKAANTGAGLLPPAALVALAAMALLAGIGPGTADISDRWGAIAYGSNGVYGTARQFRTDAAVAQAARQACGDRCTAVITFLRECAAFAAGKNGTASVARDRYLVRARDRALQACGEKDTECKIRVTVCTHTP